MPQVDAYLKILHDQGGSDLHMSAGVSPKIRVHGKLLPLKEGPMASERLRPLVPLVLGRDREDSGHAPGGVPEDGGDCKSRSGRRRGPAEPLPCVPNSHGKAG